MSAAAVLAAGAALGATLAGHEVLTRAGAWRVRRRLAGGEGRAGAGAGAALPAWLVAALERAGIDDPSRALRGWAAGIGLASVLALLSAGGRILLVLALVGPPVAVRLAGGRLARRRTAQLPEALDAVAAGLRAGLGLTGAIAGASAVGPPLGPELHALAREVEAGRPLRDAIGRWSDGADPATTLAGAALGMAADVGGPGARAVDGAAASLRDRLAAEGEADALATQAKASAAVLAVAPIGFAVLLTSLDPTAARFLLGTPAGWLCIAVGLGLDVVGACWMAALVRRHR